MVIVEWWAGLIFGVETCETFSLFCFLVLGLGYFFCFLALLFFFVLRHRWVSHIFATWAQGGGSGPYLNAAVRLHSFKQEFCKVITKHLPAKTLKCLFDWKTNHFSFLFTFWGAETLSLNLWKTVVHFSWNVLGCHGLPLLKQEIWSLIHAALLS